MKGRLKKILSFFLVIGLVGGVCQIPAEKTLAATTPVKLDNLGLHGTTKIGSKTKSGDWYKMTVESKTAFCMNLGYTCHTGDQYSVIRTLRQHGEDSISICPSLQKMYIMSIRSMCRMWCRI